MLSSVQFLRGLAAMLVVIVHATTFWPEQFPGSGVDAFRAGASGVDLFFTISGFVMLYSITGKSDGAAAAFRFISARAIRIFPLYWIVTTIKVITNFVAPEMLVRPGISLVWIVSSYFLIPAYAPDGKVEPVISVGWTLSFEMMFYVGLAILIYMRANVVFGSFLIFGSIAISGLFRPEGVAILSLANPIVFEFCLGMTAFILFNKNVLLSQRVAILVTVLSVGVCLAASSAYDFETLGRLRVLVWGVPAFFILYGAVSLERFFKGGLARLVEIMGDASYSLYLTHILTFRVLDLFLDKIVNIDNVNPNIFVYFLILVSVFISTVVGVICYYYLERPMLQALRRVFLSGRSSAVASSEP